VALCAALPAGHARAAVNRVWVQLFFPTDAEQARLLPHLRAKRDRLHAAEDILWALLNANAFLFNH
jgi:hypothetical protein